MLERNFFLELAQRLIIYVKPDKAEVYHLIIQTTMLIRMTIKKIMIMNGKMYTTGTIIMVLDNKK